MNKRQKGSEQEILAAGFLRQSGYEILCLNFSSKTGEIDIIGLENGILCFIEVKYRRNLNTGFPAEAVTASKQMKIIRTSEYYMMLNHLTGIDRRYDIVEIVGNRIRLIRNAFGGV